MSDGREEREAQEKRFEQHPRENREDVTDPDDIVNEWEPERVDSLTCCALLQSPQPNGR